MVEELRNQTDAQGRRQGLWKRYRRDGDLEDFWFYQNNVEIPNPPILFLLDWLKLV